MNKLGWLEFTQSKTGIEKKEKGLPQEQPAQSQSSQLRESNTATGPQHLLQTGAMQQQQEPKALGFCLCTIAAEHKLYMYITIMCIVRLFPFSVAQAFRRT
jgi:hypothetical protein